jgi:bifunctional non-homologous end joining protein LigD
VPAQGFQPLAVGRRPAAFNHPDYFFEIKWDGFRSLVHIEHGRCKLVSRNQNEFKSFSTLNSALASELRKHDCVIDGEIVCLDDGGKPQFYDLLFRRGEPRLCAFDLLWCDGEDLRYSPLTDRKRKLRALLPESDHVFFCDHIEQHGVSLFGLACERDLEGIVAKRKGDPYLPGTAWLKIRNQNYSQWAGRHEIFERERETDPDLHQWDQCALVCEEQHDNDV